MEKTLLGTREEWNPFQFYPTNMLQLILEYMPAVTRSEPAAKLKAIFDKHNELLGEDIRVDIMYEASGMARKTSLYRWAVMHAIINNMLQFKSSITFSLWHVQFLLVCSGRDDFRLAPSQCNERRRYKVTPSFIGWAQS